MNGEPNKTKQRERQRNKAAVILCGGKSSRMGRAKAELMFGDETMLQRVARVLSQVVDHIVIVAAADQAIPSFEKLDTNCSWSVARDTLEFAGPLAGMNVGLSELVGLESTDECCPDFAYVTSCDVPFLNTDFVQELFRRAENYDIAVPVDEKHLHPLAAVYRVGLAERVQQLVTDGERRPRVLFDLVPTNRIPTTTLERYDSGLMTLVNLNSPSEYKAALEKAGLPIPGWVEGTA